MKMDVQIQGKTLRINGREVEFDHDIRAATAVGERVIVLLGIPFDETYCDNVFALSPTAQVIWRVQSPDPKLIGDLRLPYEQMQMLDTGQIAVSDFYGRRFFVDVRTGRLTGKDLVK